MSRILKISLLGSADLKLGDDSLKLSAKAKALLIYLVCTKRPQTRAHLANLLYDGSEKQARSNLRNILSELNRSMEGDILVINRETIAFNANCLHQVDVVELEDALNNVIQQHVATGSLTSANLNKAAKALELHLGGFLDDLFVLHAPNFDEWQSQRRSEHERLMRESLVLMIRHALAAGALKDGEDLTRRLLHVDSSLELAHQFLMKLLAMQGRRDEALRQYQTCKDILDRELAVEPAPETTLLYEQIRTDGGILPREERNPGIERSSSPTPPCPYRGLSAFTEEDAHLFFGRDEFTQRLIDAIESRTTVTLVGPSGSGKSSVVMAGVVPKLLNQPNKTWQIINFRPGEDPFWGIAHKLIPLLEPDLGKAKQLSEAKEFADRLSEGQPTLSNCLSSIQQFDPDVRLLVIVDQFEELYTPGSDSDLRRLFLNALVEIVEATKGPSPRLVLILRSDFLGQTIDYPLMWEAMQESFEPLRSMTREQLRKVIKKPAQLHNVSFEAKLVDRILDDVGEEIGNLPLLEFTLAELWQHQHKQILTHVAYEEIGQIKGALGRYAEKVYRNLNREEQEQARRLFIQLVNPGDGTDDTRRQATRNDLEAEWPLVTELATKRLVVTQLEKHTNEPETVEIVHEVLIRHWQQLKDWMNEARTFRTWQERLRFALIQWQDSGQNSDALLRGIDLAKAEHWLTERKYDLQLLEREFIQQSVKRHNKERYVRWGLVVLSAVLLCILLWMNGPSIRTWRLTRCLPECSYGNLSGLDLSGMNLTQAILNGADISWSNLSGSILSEAELNNANLSNANLRNADLHEANLIDTNLYMADLQKTKLWGTKLRGANLEEANLLGADLNWADLTGSKLEDSTQISSKWRLVWEIVNNRKEKRELREADLIKANLWGAYLRQADLRSAELSEANLSEATLAYADLSNVDLSKARLEGTRMWEVNLSGANLRSAYVRGADLEGAQLTGSDLRGADLTGSNLRQADLTNAIYDATTVWPEGFDPLGAGAIPRE